MADLSDVSDAFVSLIAGFLYPNGPDAPSLLGLEARVYPGWPLPADLEKDLAETPSISHVSVYPRPDEHNTYRYVSEGYEEKCRPAPTITLTPSVNTADGSTLVAIAGTVPASAASPQNIAIFVNGKPYLRQVQPADTLLSIAQTLATAIAADVPGTLTAQAAVWLPADALLGPCRVGVTGSVEREVGRQEKVWQITVWSAEPEIRDRLAKAVDGLLRKTPWLTLCDGSRGRNIYRSSHQSDQLQREGAYKRDLLYSVEYATLDELAAPEIIVFETNATSQVDGANGAPTPLATVYS